MRFSHSTSAFGERVTAVKTLATGKWRSILQEAGIRPEFLTKINVPCPLCGGKDRFSFSEKFGHGSYFCRQCGHGDAIDLLRRFMKCDFMTAVKFAERSLGIEYSQSAAEPQRSCADGAQEVKEEVTEEVRRLRLMTQVWSESVPVTAGDSVSRYLAGRGLEPETEHVSTEVRFHPSLFLYEGGKHSRHDAMVARVTDAKGNLINLHRTYIDNGRKAKVSAPKKLMQGRLRGGAVRLTPAGEVLGIAEGIETALAAQDLFGISVWAVIGCTNMAEFTDIPDTVKKVVIFADNDENYAGQAAAYALSHSLKVRGFDVEVLVPDETGDWLDEYNRHQKKVA